MSAGLPDETLDEGLLAGLPDETLDEGLFAGLPDETLDDGLLAGRLELEDEPEGLTVDEDDFAASLFPELEDLEYEDSDEREAELLEDLDEDDERELPRDCASRSYWKATNANPISIAANDFADNLIVLNLSETDESLNENQNHQIFKVNKYGTSSITHEKPPHLFSRNS